MLRADYGQHFLPDEKLSDIFCELGSQVWALYAPLKLRKRKKVEKANQKLKKESKDSAPVKDIDTENIEANDETQGEAEQIDCKNLKTDNSLSGGQDSNSNEIKSEPDGNETEGLKIKTDQVVNENDDSFIGPKLPPLLTEQEKDAFFKELLAKLPS